MHTPRLCLPLLRKKGGDLLINYFCLPFFQLWRLDRGDSKMCTQSGIHTAQKHAQTLCRTLGTLIRVQRPVPAHALIAAQRMHLIDAIRLLLGRLKYRRGKETNGRSLLHGNQIVKETDLTMLLIVPRSALQYAEHNCIHLRRMSTVELRAFETIGGENADRRHRFLARMLRVMKHRTDGIILFPMGKGSPTPCKQL